MSMESIPYCPSAGSSHVAAGKFSAHPAIESPFTGLVGNTVSFIQKHRKHTMEPPAPHSVAHLQSGRWGCCASGRRSLLCPWHEALGAAYSAETNSFFQFSLSLGWFNDLGLCRTAGKPTDVGWWCLDGARRCVPPSVYGTRTQLLAFNGPTEPHGWQCMRR